ncbi:hypothetical protein P3T37_006486 [Kitasatospora sp. MAA4]|uniref:type II secretion system F family protein n=1 Tax=Kitasatospora sp. MAA4 TaxID=3035093 RepID=UPI002474AD87|nr:type II secretion system F family protein [Kitasatospora sp. MAA4]MDH6137055.1 hypothetical protein [Kitasatospora sp. MAA4]
MSGVSMVTLGSCAVPLSTLVGLLELAGAIGASGSVFSLVGWWLRRRRARRRAAHLEASWQGASPMSAGHRSGTAQKAEVPSVQPRLRRELALSALAGLLAAVVIGGPVGLLVGLLTAVGVRRWLPAVPSAALRQREREDARLITQLPLASELLAACLSSSASPAQAAAVVAQTVGGPLGARLSAVSAELSLGAPPVLCWGRLGDDCPDLAPLARCLVRTSVSGAPPAVPLAGLAVAQRAAAGRAARERVRRAGVLATAPLGLCFLPAFVLIGIVPVVMGLAASFAHRI